MNNGDFKEGTYDADTSSSCFSASSLFMDSSSTFSSIFYRDDKFKSHINMEKDNKGFKEDYNCSQSQLFKLQLRLQIIIIIIK